MHNPSILTILSHTPGWVWLLLAALLALGFWQVRPRQLAPRRIVALPLVMLALSLFGVATAFRGAALPAALLAWGAGIAVALATGRAGPLAVRGARWLADSGRLQVPGSWLPLLLIVALFALKYGVGVDLALHPQRAADAALAAPIGFAYGVFSGLFLARARSLWAQLPPAVARREAVAPTA